MTQQVQQKSYKCFVCNQPVKFNGQKAVNMQGRVVATRFNLDGTVHVCVRLR